MHVTFGQLPKYEARSYTWGSEKKAIEIDRQTFLVGDNLWEALIGTTNAYCRACTLD